jgi:CTP synthase
MGYGAAQTKDLETTINKSDVDIVIIEVGGTVGDIESLPFLEAIRQIRGDVGRENTLYIHLTLVPFIQTAGGAQVQTNQHSVKASK